MTPTQKAEIQNLTKDVPKVSFNKYVADVKNRTFKDCVIAHLDEDAQIIAVLQSMQDLKSFLVKTEDNVYYLIDENVKIFIDVEVIPPVNLDEDDDADLCISVYNEDTDDYDEVEDLTISDCVILSLKQMLFPEANAYFLKEEDAVKYPLS